MKRLTYIIASGVVSSAVCGTFAAGVQSVVPQRAIGFAAASKPAVDDAHEARRVMAEAADHALSKRGVEALLEIVARSDRDRIEKEMTKGDDKAYQALADKVNKAWKDKYGKPFSAEGHIKDLSSLKVTTTGQGHNQQAFITFPAEEGQAGYELHLTREKNGWWRIQLPDTVDGKSFYANAMKGLQRVDDGSSKWPATVDAAYPVVVTQILQEMAVPAAAK